MYDKAHAGSEQAAQLLWDREMGKPAQMVGIANLDGEDIHVIFEGAEFLNEDNTEEAEFEEKGGNGQAE